MRTKIFKRLMKAKKCTKKKYKIDIKTYILGEKIKINWKLKLWKKKTLIIRCLKKCIILGILINKKIEKKKLKDKRNIKLTYLLNWSYKDLGLKQKHSTKRQSIKNRCNSQYNKLFYKNKLMLFPNELSLILINFNSRLFNFHL